MKIIDGMTLAEEDRALLRPGERWTDGGGVERCLPRYFYAIDSWAEAKETRLTEHFTLAEVMAVDCREVPRLLRKFPHFVPCAVAVLARYLEEFRRRADAPVFVSVNGGYRSPGHRRHKAATPHAWACAADIFRVGETWIDSAKAAERYARLAEGIGKEVRVKPYGSGGGEADDHLHLDIGFLTLEPHAVST